MKPEEIRSRRWDEAARQALRRASAARPQATIRASAPPRLPARRFLPFNVNPPTLPNPPYPPHSTHNIFLPNSAYYFSQISTLCLVGKKGRGKRSFRDTAMVNSKNRLAAPGHPPGRFPIAHGYSLSATSCLPRPPAFSGAGPHLEKRAPLAGTILQRKQCKPPPTRFV